jgi:hypothetical protein
VTRGGARRGTGPKPRAGVTMSEMLRAPATPAQLWWAEHVAAAAGLTVAEWIRSLVDRGISEHRCQDCSGGKPRKE